MPTFEELQDHFASNIRKGLQGSVFVKRWDAEDDPITKLGDDEGLLAVPTGYGDVGILTKDQGVSWTREVETSETAGLGYAEPVRRDVLSEVRGLSFTALETRKTTLELFDGIDLSAVTHDADGNVSYDTPDRPAIIYYRVLVLFKDGDGADAIYMGKWGPRMNVTDRGENSMNEANEIQYPLTFSSTVDPDVGTSLRTMFFSPNAALIEDMGFAAATP